MKRRWLRERYTLGMKTVPDARRTLIQMHSAARCITHNGGHPLQAVSPPAPVPADYTRNRSNACRSCLMAGCFIASSAAGGRRRRMSCLNGSNLWRGMLRLCRRPGSIWSGTVALSLRRLAEDPGCERSWIAKTEDFQTIILASEVTRSGLPAGT